MHKGWFTYSYCHNDHVRQFREMTHGHPHPIRTHDFIWYSLAALIRSVRYSQKAVFRRRIRRYIPNSSYFPARSTRSYLTVGGIQSRRISCGQAKKWERRQPPGRSRSGQFRITACSRSTVPRATLGRRDPMRQDRSQATDRDPGEMHPAPPPLAPIDAATVPLFDELGRSDHVCQRGQRVQVGPSSSHLILRLTPCVAAT